MAGGRNLDPQTPEKMTLLHGLAALSSPGCLLAFLAYAVVTAVLPFLNRFARVGTFLNSCVLTLGTPALVIFLTLAAGHGLHPLGAHGTGTSVHADQREIISLIVLAIALCIALILIEFAGIDTRGLPSYLVGLFTIKLFFDTNPALEPVFPGWLTAVGIFVLVAFVAILLRLVVDEEAADIAEALKRDRSQARLFVKQSLTPAINVLPAVLGACLYGAAVAVR
jgi:hypothetical protein